MWLIKRSRNNAENSWIRRRIPSTFPFLGIRRFKPKSPNPQSATKNFFQIEIESTCLDISCRSFYKSFESLQVPAKRPVGVESSLVVMGSPKLKVAGDKTSNHCISPKHLCILLIERSSRIIPEYHTSRKVSWKWLI